MRMTASQTYDSQNIFAKILRGELACVKVHEDDDVLAFMDIFPQSRGHTLVIPKRARATTLFDIDPDALCALIVGTQTVAKAVERALSPDGVRIIQFNGAPAGQTVFHIHFHIVPVYSGGSEAPHAAGGKPADPVELEKLAAKIRAQL
jgi:histidine triad (HIT) family protein